MAVTLLITATQEYSFQVTTQYSDSSTMTMPVSTPGEHMLLARDAATQFIWDNAEKYGRPGLTISNVSAVETTQPPPSGA